MSSHDEVQVGIRLSHEVIPPGTATVVWALIEITSRGALRDEGSRRLPINVGLVLDRSGSMTGEPLEYVKNAASFVVGQMAETDRLALVVFDDKVNVLWPSQQVSNKDQAKSVIAGIQPGGTTNLSGGLLSGCREVLKGVAPGQVNRVILLTDGEANVGVTDPRVLAAKVQSMVEKGLSITSVGVGHSFNEDLLITVSESGRGNFYYIKNPDEIPQVFARELQGLLRVVAQGMKLTLASGPEFKLVGILGYDPTPTAGGLAVDLPDMYESESKVLIVEMVCPALPVGGYEVLKVRLEYSDSLGDLDTVRTDVKVNLDVAPGPPGVHKPNIEVVKQVELTRAAVAKDEMVQALDAGDLKRGLSMLRERIESLGELKAELGDDPEVSEEIHRLEDLSRSFEQAEGIAREGVLMEASVRKDLRYESYRRRRGGL